VIKLAGQVGSAMTTTPMYLRIADDIRGQITAGILKPGDQLPTTSALKAQYETSSTAVRGAMIVLRGEGLIEGRQGKGVYVAQPAGPAAT
jgi:GntR family transcriptional regulator